LSHIYLVSAAGGAATRVPNSARATTPSWQPNGKALVVTSRNSRGVARLDILATDGSVRRAIAGTSHGVGGDVSPDGTRILFTQDFYGVPNTSRVCVCGGTPSVVVPNDGPAHDDVTWSPSGRSFYFSDGGQTINHYTASGRVIARVAGDGSKEIHPTVRDVAVRRPVPGVGMPVRGADFTGDGRADLAVFRPANGRWFVKGQPSVAYGKVGDVPVAANYVGNRRAEIAVFRPSTGAWHIRGRAPLTYGQAGDIPVPADYNGDGRAEIAVFRPSTGAWHIRGRAPLTYGQAGDIPVPADYNGDGRAETAVYRPGTGTWYVPGRAAIVFGTRSDLPAPADYNGDGRADLARYRPSNGRFEVRGRAATSTPMRVLGAPVSGNFTGDRKAEAMVFDGWRWYSTSTRTSTAFGGFGDLPV
jgi:hypothetical protein